MAWFGGEFWNARRFFLHTAIIKASLEYVGLYGGPVRPPFKEMPPDAKQELWALLKQIGVTKIGQLTLEFNLRETLPSYMVY
jgi:hypothetical protein